MALMQAPGHATAIVAAMIAWALLAGPIIAILYAFGERQQQQTSRQSPNDAVSSDE